MNRSGSRLRKLPRAGRRRLHVVFFALVLALACCLTARAAVVEADSVERDVDTPVGVQKETGLSDQGAATAPEPVETPPAPGVQATSQPDPGAQVTPENSPVPLDTPTSDQPSGGGGSLLGFVIVGLVVVVVGTGVVLLVAKTREQRR